MDTHQGKGNKVMKVIVDSRETSQRKKKAEKIFDEIVIKQLEYGDYVYKDTGVEFKTVSDFISSVKSKRMQNQAVGLRENYNHHYVIIYGDVQKTLRQLYRTRHPFSVNQFLGALASISQITHVLHVDNEMQAFRLTRKLFEKSTDNKNRLVRKPTNNHKNKIVTVLTIIGNINTKRAEQLVNELDIKTVEDLLGLTYEDITSLKGFGDKTAKNILAYLKD